MREGLAHSLRTARNKVLSLVEDVRPKGEPEATDVGLTPETVATGLERLYRERVAWWGGAEARPPAELPPPPATHQAPRREDSAGGASGPTGRLLGMDRDDNYTVNDEAGYEPGNSVAGPSPIGPWAGHVNKNGRTTMVAMEGVVHVTLHGAGGEYRVPSPFWVTLTSLAAERGWQPCRASLARIPETACELILARVTDEGTRALAQALEAALPAIPDHDALAAHPERRLVWDARSAGGPFLSKPPQLTERLSGANKRLVRDLVALARAGGFAMHDASL